MTEYIIDWDTGLVIDTFSKNNLREEIVRCRDCRHYEFGEVHMFDGRKPKRHMCARMAGCRVATEPDGFCWRGERRDA